MKQYPVKKVALPSGETLAYREAGSGSETLLLIHGNLSSSVHWQTLMEQLEGRYRIIAPDMRGFGDSTYHARFDSILELARDVEQLIDALGINDFFVMGWSTGGAVSMEIAADWPQRVKKLLLLSSVPAWGYYLYERDGIGRPNLSAPYKTKDEIAADTAQIIPLIYAYLMQDRAHMQKVWNSAIYDINMPPEEDYEEYVTAMLKQRNMVDTRYALNTFNITHEPSLVCPGSGRIDFIRCPVVMFHGREDRLALYDWALRMNKRYFIRSKLVTFENAGHSIPTDKLFELASAVVEELQ